MIETNQVCKTFGRIRALDSVSTSIRTGAVYGIIGSNGAGKSTYLRVLAGVLKPDSGTAVIDGEEIFENLAVKEQCFYISDEQYFLPGSTPEEMERYYRMYYPKFDHERFLKLVNGFGLDPKRKIRTFSKGMKKQVSVICAMASGAQYLFCDETFDGLDPVARQAVKSLFALDVEERGITTVIASHNLREMEDICDHVGLLHKGGILLSRDLDDMKMSIQKVQCLPGDCPLSRLFEGFEVMSTEWRGRMLTATVRGERAEVEEALRGFELDYFELIPLTLEEIFVAETEVTGYDIKSLIL
ncbi:MAG: ABC transporter ATP-binding protein [Butyricicoccaceae bacterium]